MYRYTLEETDLIINTLIEINKKENRRVIDIIDINNYKHLILEKAKEKNINIFFNNMIDTNIEDYIYIVEDSKTKYVMLPWVTSEDLIEKFRGYLPLDLCVILCDKEIKENIPVRSKLETTFFNDINSNIANMFTEKLLDNINKLEKQKQKEQKKLRKIKEITKGNKQY